MELQLFLSQISPILKLKVSWEILNNLFLQNPVLRVIYLKQNVARREYKPESDGQDFLTKMVSRMQIQFYNPEQIVFSQGEVATHVYFITRGSAAVSLQET